MSQEALISLFYEAWVIRDLQFQTWLAVTFAVIVAVYMTAPSITRFLRALIATVYLVSSAILLAGWLTLAAHAGEHAAQLEQKYEYVFPILFPWVAPALIVLMTLVTIGVTVFVCFYSRQNEST